MKKFTKILSTLLLSGVCLFSVSCSFGKTNQESTSSVDSSVEETPTSYTVSISQTTYTTVEDETFDLTATATPFGSIKWSTDNPQVATVSDGKVLCKAAGTATITATCGNGSASCVVTVAARDQTFTVLEAPVSAFALEKGGESVAAAFAAYTVDPDGNKTKIEDAEITYEVANVRIVTLENGVMSTLASQRLTGPTTITATYGDIQTTVPVTVYDKFIDTAAEWNEVTALQGNMGKYYLLTEDIDFSSTEYKGGNHAATVAEAATSFRGEIEGNGHVIKNVNLSSTQNVSLFGSLYGAKISNIHFENVTLSGGHAAGIASAIGGTTEIKNIYLQATISSAGNQAILANNSAGWNGEFSNVVAEISCSGALAVTNDTIPSFATVTNVYAYTDGEVSATTGVSIYQSLVAMAWELNGKKALPLSAWEYHGGTTLPTLLKKI